MTTTSRQSRGSRLGAQRLRAPAPAQDRTTDRGPVVEERASAVLTVATSATMGVDSELGHRSSGREAPEARTERESHAVAIMRRAEQIAAARRAASLERFASSSSSSTLTESQVGRLPVESSETLAARGAAILERIRQRRAEAQRLIEEHERRLRSKANSRTASASTPYMSPSWSGEESQNLSTRIEQGFHVEALSTSATEDNTTMGRNALAARQLARAQQRTDRPLTPSSHVVERIHTVMERLQCESGTRGERSPEDSNVQRREDDAASGGPVDPPATRVLNPPRDGDLLQDPTRYPRAPDSLENPVHTIQASESIQAEPGRTRSEIQNVSRSSSYLTGPEKRASSPQLRHMASHETACGPLHHSGLSIGDECDAACAQASMTMKSPPQRALAEQESRSSAEKSTGTYSMPLVHKDAWNSPDLPRVQSDRSTIQVQSAARTSPCMDSMRDRESRASPRQGGHEYSGTLSRNELDAESVASNRAPLDASDSLPHPREQQSTLTVTLHPHDADRGWDQVQASHHRAHPAAVAQATMQTIDSWDAIELAQHSENADDTWLAEDATEARQTMASDAYRANEFDHEEMAPWEHQSTEAAETILHGYPTVARRSELPHVGHSREQGDHLPVLSSLEPVRSRGASPHQRHADDPEQRYPFDSKDGELRAWTIATPLPTVQETEVAPRMSLTDANVSVADTFIALRTSAAGGDTETRATTAPANLSHPRLYQSAIDFSGALPDNEPADPTLDVVSQHHQLQFEVSYLPQANAPDRRSGADEAVAKQSFASTSPDEHSGASRSPRSPETCTDAPRSTDDPLYTSSNAATQLPLSWSSDGGAAAMKMHATCPQAETPPQPTSQREDSSRSWTPSQHKTRASPSTSVHSPGYGRELPLATPEHDASAEAMHRLRLAETYSPELVTDDPVHVDHRQQVQRRERPNADSDVDGTADDDGESTAEHPWGHEAPWASTNVAATATPGTRQALWGTITEGAAFFSAPDAAQPQQMLQALAPSDTAANTDAQTCEEAFTTSMVAFAEQPDTSTQGLRLDTAFETGVWAGPPLKHHSEFAAAPVMRPGADAHSANDHERLIDDANTEDALAGRSTQASWEQHRSQASAVASLKASPASVSPGNAAAHSAVNDGARWDAREATRTLHHVHTHDDDNDDKLVTAISSLQRTSTSPPASAANDAGASVFSGVSPSATNAMMASQAANWSPVGKPLCPTAAFSSLGYFALSAPRVLCSLPSANDAFSATPIPISIPGTAPWTNDSDRGSCSDHADPAEQQLNTDVHVYHTWSLVSELDGIDVDVTALVHWLPETDEPLELRQVLERFGDRLEATWERHENDDSASRLLCRLLCQVLPNLVHVSEMSHSQSVASFTSGSGERSLISSRANPASRKHSMLPLSPALCHMLQEHRVDAAAASVVVLGADEGVDASQSHVKQIERALLFGQYRTAIRLAQQANDWTLALLVSEAQAGLWPPDERSTATSGHLLHSIPDDDDDVNDDDDDEEEPAPQHWRVQTIRQLLLSGYARDSLLALLLAVMIADEDLIRSATRRLVAPSGGAWPWQALLDCLWILSPWRQQQQQQQQQQSGSVIESGHQAALSRAFSIVAETLTAADHDWDIDREMLCRMIAAESPWSPAFCDLLLKGIEPGVPATRLSSLTLTSTSTTLHQHLNEASTSDLYQKATGTSLAACASSAARISMPAPCPVYRLIFWEVYRMLWSKRFDPEAPSGADAVHRERSTRFTAWVHVSLAEALQDVGRCALAQRYQIPVIAGNESAEERTPIPGKHCIAPEAAATQTPGMQSWRRAKSTAEATAASFSPCREQSVVVSSSSSSACGVASHGPASTLQLSPTALDAVHTWNGDLSLGHRGSIATGDGDLRCSPRAAEATTQRLVVDATPASARLTSSVDEVVASPQRAVRADFQQLSIVSAGSHDDQQQEQQQERWKPCPYPGSYHSAGASNSNCGEPDAEMQFSSSARDTQRVPVEADAETCSQSWASSPALSAPRPPAAEHSSNAGYGGNENASFSENRSSTTHSGTSQRAQVLANAPAARATSTSPDITDTAAASSRSDTESRVLPASAMHPHQERVAVHEVPQRAACPAATDTKPPAASASAEAPQAKGLSRLLPLRILGGLFARKQANLGLENKFYYDDKLGRWVCAADDVDAAGGGAVLAPPPSDAELAHKSAGCNETSAAATKEQVSGAVASESSTRTLPGALPPVAAPCPGTTTMSMTTRNQVSRPRSIRQRYVDVLGAANDTSSACLPAPVPLLSTNELQERSADKSKAHRVPLVPPAATSANTATRDRTPS